MKMRSTGRSSRSRPMWAALGVGVLLASIVTALSVVACRRSHESGAAKEGLDGANEAADGQRHPLPSAQWSCQLPNLPADLEWDKGDQREVNEAVEFAGSDPVAAALILKTVLEQKKEPPTAEQRKWLVAALAVAQPIAEKILRHDMNDAIARRDLRDATIIMAVSGRLEKGMLAGKAEAIAALRNRLYSGEEFGPRIWQVSEVRGEFLQGEYSESASDDKITVSAGESFVLLRVKALVKNVSSEGDLPYITRAFSGLKGALLQITLSGDEETTGQQRYAMDEFFYLISPEGNLVSCSHVCEGCSALRGMTMRTSSNDDRGVRMEFTGGPVEQGEEFEADLIFSAPKGIAEFRFLLFGAPLVPVEITTLD